MSFASYMTECLFLFKNLINLVYFRKGCHLPEDDIFTVEILVRVAFLQFYQNPNPKLTLGISNGDEVISVGERRINLEIPSKSGNQGFYNWQYKPIIDISMTLLEDKVFSRNEIVVVEGIVEHMFKSKGESHTTEIRFVK